MLRDLTIKNYRAFKDFSIDGLARVNLIVGQNNAGKTSFLEAVYLLVNQHSPSVLLELLDRRGEFASLPDAPGRIEYQTSYLFNDFQLSVERLRPNHMISISSQEEEYRSAQFMVTSRRSSFGSPQPGLQIDASYSAPIEDAPLALDISENYFFSSSTRFNTLRRPPSRYHFVGTELSDLDYLSNLYNRILQNTSIEKHAIISTLQLIEPRIEDFHFLGQQTPGRVLLELVDREGGIPLSSMGEGLRRILTLALHSLVSERGVLLIDEIDTGLYHGVQTDVWRFLIEIARHLNVQIFATTHSWDCVEAFQEALADSTDPNEGKLFRLQRRGDTIYPVDYTVEQLGVAVRHAIEVR